jgi:hypothetical protein
VPITNTDGTERKGLITLSAEDEEHATSSALSEDSQVENDSDRTKFRHNTPKVQNPRGLADSK